MKRKVARKRLEPDDRRAQLLELGLAMFGERSYEDISIDELARAAKISKGLLYHYFPTKRDFYLAALREAAQRLFERTELDPSRAALDQLRDGLDSYHAYVERHGSSYAALLRGGVGSDREVAKIVDEIRERFIARLVEGMQLGEPGPSLPPLVHGALRGWIGFLEVTTLDWIERRRVDRFALRELQVEVLLSAVRAAM